MAANHHDVARMLANPVRARILRLLLTIDTVSVPMLTDAMPAVKRKTLGHHVRLLLNADVIELVGRTRRARRPGGFEHEYRLAVDRNLLRGLLWGQAATVVNNGSGRDGAAILDSRGLDEFAALTANFVAALSEIERKANERLGGAGNQNGTACAVVVLVAKDQELM